jgi:protein TonB
MDPRIYLPLARALLLSLVLHAALLASGVRLPWLLPGIISPTDPVLKVRLPDPLPVPAAQPELVMPEDTPPAAAPAVKPAARPVEKRLTRPPSAVARAPAGVGELSGEAARRAREQIARELLYPLEAIERGLEGEVLVMLFLDEAGNAIAARVEASSGHKLLDDAAVRAARTLKSLPASAPREALVPVRFRLR